MARKRASPARRYPRKTESRLDRIHALLDYAETQIGDIVHTYEQVGHASLEIAINIKNCCENMRSALDYLAYAIFERTYPGKPLPEKLYLPMMRTRKEAEKEINRQFPDLRVLNRDLWEALHSFQPYKRGNQWLRRFLSVVNDHKHWDLVAQRARKIGVDSPRAKGFAPLAFIDEEKGIISDFRFRGIEVSAPFLLQQPLVEIRYFIVILRI